MARIRKMPEHRMEFVVEVYTSIRLASMITNKTMSQWIRDIVEPRAEEIAKDFRSEEPKR